MQNLFESYIILGTKFETLWRLDSDNVNLIYVFKKESKEENGDDE